VKVNIESLLYLTYQNHCGELLETNYSFHNPRTYAENTKNKGFGGGKGKGKSAWATAGFPSHVEPRKKGKINPLTLAL
jgi:hypothetical protein